MLKQRMFVGAVLLALSAPAFAQPQLTIKTEEAAHPRIVKAIHEMEDAYKYMEGAAHDFGGNKGRAMADTKAAIHSLRKALYFRLKMDDAAIDRAQ
jgi:hypothetical protein